METTRNVALAFAALALGSTATARQTRPLRILPLGDSITQGGNGTRPEFTWRYPLYYMLLKEKYVVDFIGSMKTGLNPAFKWPARDGVKFDLDHEGHYGWKTAPCRDNLAKWMTKYPGPPDVVLIHLGTNDQGSKNFPKDVVKPLADMITMFRKKNPRVIVFVGHLNFTGGAAAKMRPLVEAMAKKMSTRVSPVVTVHHYKGFNANPKHPQTDTFDWAHPNERGQQKMAEAWFKAMKPYLDALLGRRPRRR